MSKSPKVIEQTTEQLVAQAKDTLQRNAEWLREFKEIIRNFKQVKAEFEKEHSSGTTQPWPRSH